MWFGVQHLNCNVKSVAMLGRIPSGAVEGDLMTELSENLLQQYGSRGDSA
jgi:hypothetical protein